MSRFNTLMQLTAARQQLAMHGESVSYYRNGEELKTGLVALVVRDPVTIYQWTGQAQSGAIIMFVADATSGMLASEVDTDIDQIGYAIDIGSDVVIKQVNTIVSSHGGMTCIHVS